MHTLSSNSFSHDIQVVDALSWLHIEYPEHHKQVREQFPEDIIWEQPIRTWFDTDSMGVDTAWSSWLCDAIEDTGVVQWIDGEPFGIMPDERWPTEDDEVTEQCTL